MFDNNWDLSARRAVAVASQMTRIEDFDIARMTVSGHASNSPIDNRNTRIARQTNRRVEIIVTHGQAKLLDDVQLLEQRNN
jgi:chemotaxis protein MotB